MRSLNVNRKGEHFWMNDREEVAEKIKANVVFCVFRSSFFDCCSFFAIFSRISTGFDYGNPAKGHSLVARPQNKAK